MIQFLKNLNWVDILVIILLFRSSYIGLKKGLWIEVFKIFGILTALFFALNFYERLGILISSKAALPENFSKFLIFLAILFSIIFIFKILRNLLQLVVNVEVKENIDSVGGAFLGLFRGAIVCSLVLLALVLLPSRYIKEGVEKKSLIASHLIDKAPKIHHFFAKNMPSKK